MPADLSFTVDYDHVLLGEHHTVEGARETLRALFAEAMPESVLDIGCGTGTWLRAALDCGATAVVGVDGGELPADLLAVPEAVIAKVDLGRPFSLDRKFDLVLCLEVAEHLDPASAQTIVDTITAHGDRILFSAAVPGQPGAHHVNCQWPSYWQRLFNERGYACDDWVRWRIWDNRRIEPWYRQNLMIAVRDEERAGGEPRISAILHPEVVAQPGWALRNADYGLLEQGLLPFRWYLAAPVKATLAKLGRALGRGR